MLLGEHSDATLIAMTRNFLTRLISVKRTHFFYAWGISAVWLYAVHSKSIGYEFKTI